MIITERTKLKDVLPLLVNEERLNNLLNVTPEYPLEKDIISLTIGEFADIITNEDNFLYKLLDPKEKAYIAIGRLKNFRRQMEELERYLKKFDIPQTREEKAASMGVDFPTFIERMLITATQFFHLQSFEQAEKITIAEYLLILKEQFSSAIYQRNYNKILEKKSKIKNGRK